MTMRRMVGVLTAILGYAGVCLAPAFAQPVHNHPGDTLSFDQRCLIFYTPSVAQLKASTKSRVAALDSLSRQSDRTKRGIVPFLRKMGITSVTTDKMVFRFVHSDTTVHCKRKSRDLFGVIMYSPGKTPMVIRGVPTDVELLNRMFPYYGIR